MKPMSSVESQHPTSTPAVREIKVRDGTPWKIQVLSCLQQTAVAPHPPKQQVNYIFLEEGLGVALQ